MGISSLLERYKHLRPPDEAVRVAIQQAISSCCKIDIALKDVSLKNGTVVVVGSPALRMEVVLHRKQILTELQHVLGEKAPKDLR